MTYLRPHLDARRIALEVGDITNYRLMLRVFQKYKPEYASHQASMMIMDSDKFPFDAIVVNIKGTFHFIQCCIETGVKRVTFASSASVFGDPRYTPVDEDHPYDNRTLYGATKIAVEHLFKSWGYIHHLPWCGFRYYNIYSERQGLGAFYTQVFQKWILKVHAGEPIQVYGDGEQTMDLVHASDAARANVLALTNEAVCYELFNIGSGVEVTANQLKDMIFARMGRTVAVEHVSYDRHLVRRRQASIEKARQLLGFQPSVPLKEGLDRYVKALVGTGSG